MGFGPEQDRDWRARRSAVIACLVLVSVVAACGSSGKPASSAKPDPWRNLPVSSARLLTQKDVPQGFVDLGQSDSDLANEGPSETAAVHAICPWRSEGQEAQTEIANDGDDWVGFVAGGTENPTGWIDEGILHYRGGDARRYMQELRRSAQRCPMKSLEYSEPSMSAGIHEVASGTNDDLLVYKFDFKPATMSQYTAFGRVGDDVVVVSWQSRGTTPIDEAAFANLVRAATTNTTGTATTTSTLPAAGKAFALSGRDVARADVTGSYHARLGTMFGPCTSAECNRLVADGVDWSIKKTGTGYVLSVFGTDVPVKENRGSYVAEGVLPPARRGTCPSGAGRTRFGLDFSPTDGSYDAGGTLHAYQLVGRYTLFDPTGGPIPCEADSDFQFVAIRR